jgi:lipopolysaccharide/colanic/teichoic acid biosynthesis glycosyltransferase
MEETVTPGTQAPAASRPSRIGPGGLHSVTPARFLARLRYQLLIGILLAVVLPPLLYYYENVRLAWTQPSSINTAAGTFAAFLIAIYLFRRVITLPGLGVVGHVLPALTAGYGLVLAAILAARFDYSRLVFGMSFAAATAFFFVVGVYLRRRKGQRFYLVPSPSIAALAAIPDVEWIMLREPRLPADGATVLIADLRADLGDQWERLIAEAALAGHPVYHFKQVQESVTGRVEIEHLSENSFGSLIPNHSYHKIKRLIDLALTLLLLPLLIVPGLVIALLVRLESPGPAFFRQRRRGYRGGEFTVIKYRTMVHGSGESGAKDEAITRHADSRITRIGRFLRRTRIDEMPQIWNILRGEMSWIGPRPEALSLSEWYQSELAFYSYRHIVRPGITGWAQVNQGHVAELGEVLEKLHFDFYYIKNFSAWLDLLILGRTIAIVFSGFGAK